MDNQKLSDDLALKNPKAYLLANVLLGDPEKLEAGLNEIYQKENFFALLRGSVTKKEKVNEMAVGPI